MVGWRRWAHLGLILAAVVVVYFIAPVSPDLHAEHADPHPAVAILILALLVAGVVRQLRRAPR